MTAIAYVVIDQTNIDAPDFPRPASWWQGHLPLWFAVPRWWRTPREEWDLSVITVELGTNAVVVPAEDLKHAREMARSLARSVIVQRGATVSVRAGKSESEQRLASRARPMSKPVVSRPPAVVDVPLPEDGGLF